MGKKTLFEKILQKMTHTKDPSPRGLSKYPLVVLGSNVGGALTHSITNKTHGGVPLLNIGMLETGECYTNRALYEQRRVASDKYLIKGKYCHIYIIINSKSLNY